MPYNPEIHRRHSIRLAVYDYSQAGLYFVTICVQNHECVFGEIASGEMILNEYGKMANHGWLEIPHHYPNVVLHEFVIMPNHTHGILEIVDDARRGAIYRALDESHSLNNNRVPDEKYISDNNKNTINRDVIEQGAVFIKGAINRAPTSTTNGGFANVKNPMFHENLSRFVRWYKGRTSFECRKTNPFFTWQRNYYEHIIRNQNDHARIVNYINNNPFNWETDKFYKEQK